MTTILLDTETTSIVDPEIIEMAWFTLQPLDAWSAGPLEIRHYKPSKPIQYGAMAVHHILPEHLEDCLYTSKEAVLPQDTTYLVGHNIDFDWKALGSPPCKRICTLALCRSLWPECDSHTLGAMLYFLEKPSELTRTLLKDAHSAAVDIENNHLILLHILAKLGPQTSESLWAASEKARVPKIMTFGKHKDKPIGEVDKGWVLWYTKQTDTDPYLLEAFRQHGLLPRRS